VALQAVTVVDVMDGSLFPAQTVLVVGNRIAAVGPPREVRIHGGAKRVEAAGGYLIPGLWDVHVHSVGPEPAATANRSIAPQDWHLPLFLAYGVTGVRNMNDGTGDVTLELTNAIKRQLAGGSRRGPPRFLSAGAAIDGDPYMGMTKKVSVLTPAEARAAVGHLASNGADLIKVYENLSREAYFAIIDEGAEASAWTVTSPSASLPKKPPPPVSARSSIRRPARRVAQSEPTPSGDVSRTSSPTTTVRRETRSSC
jgi:hypothetical protein